MILVIVAGLHFEFVFDFYCYGRKGCKYDMLTFRYLNGNIHFGHFLLVKIGQKVKELFLKNFMILKLISFN